MAKKGSGTDEARIAFEGGVRRKLDNPQPCDRSSLGPVFEELIDGCRAAMANLETQYLRTRNPVHVWSAIIQAWAVAQTLRQPLELPTWVQAYLICSANEIIGSAVGFKAGDRNKPPIPPEPINGVTTQYSDFFAGLTAEQRIGRVLEALGFRPGQGKNPVADAHREMKIENRVRAIESARKSMGLTLQEALDVFEFPEYKGDHGPQRFYKDRRNLSKT